jgi:hypothetical protein
MIFHASHPRDLDSAMRFHLKRDGIRGRDFSPDYFLCGQEYGEKLKEVPFNVGSSD